MLIKSSTYHLSFSRTAFWRVGVWEISTKTSSRYELGNQNGGASQKHYFCTGGEASLFSSCCTTSCVVCRSSSSSRFCSACLWLLLFLLFRRRPATPLSKCVSSPRNGRSQSAALGRPKKNIKVKIRFFHH